MYDLLLAGGLVHDGSGAPPRRADVAIADGRVRAVGDGLDRDTGTTVVDVRDRWVLPGFVDVHTHVDLALERDPGLPGLVRHGITTVAVGTCGLGLAFGAPSEDPAWLATLAATEGLDPDAVDEVARAIDWHEPDAYLRHLSGRPLGPNAAVFAPLRSMVDAAGRHAGPGERRAASAARLLEQALDAGAVGLSSGPGHHHASGPGPPTLGRASHRRLLRLVRAVGATWQAGLDAEGPGSGPAVLRLARTGRGRALRVLTTESDRGLPTAGLNGLALGRLSSVVGVDLRPGLPLPRLRVWADGPVTPLADGPLAALQEPGLGRNERREVLDDPEWLQALARWWRSRPAATSRGLRLPHDLWRLHVAAGAPVADWEGDTLGAIHRRAVAHQDGEDVARGELERDAFDGLPPVAGDEPAFLVHLFRTWDRDLRWWTDVATTAVGWQPDWAEGLASRVAGATLPVSAAGAYPAHLVLHDLGLRRLRQADAAGTVALAAAIRRLTREPAEFLDIDAGRLEVGARADVVVVDPGRLRAWDPGADLGHDPSGAEGVVTYVVVGGRPAWTENGETDALRVWGAGTVLRRQR